MMWIETMRQTLTRFSIMQAKLSLAHDLNIRWILSLRLSPFKGLQIRVIIERLRMLKSQERESDLHIQSDHPKTILIVDDEKSIRDVLIAFFVEQGYDVITASDGREGIAKFQSHPTDLVITDIVMPRVEGIETIRKIRKQSNTVKIIAMTGYVDSYLKDALLNFISLLGWNAGTDQEIYTLRELEKQFSLDNIHKAGAVFDTDKLDWINGQYIRELSIDEFFDYCLPYLEKDGIMKQTGEDLYLIKTKETLKPTYVKNILKLEQTRIKKFSEIGEAIEFFFADDLDYDIEKLVWKKSTKEETIENLKKLEELLKKTKDELFTEEKLESSIKELMEQSSIDTGSLLWPMRFALSGRERSPGPFELAAALGKEKCLKRIGNAVAKML